MSKWAVCLLDLSEEALTEKSLRRLLPNRIPVLLAEVVILSARQCLSPAKELRYLGNYVESA